MPDLTHNKNLYTDILVWSYNKQQSGFTRTELELQFNLQNEHENVRKWIQENFYNGTNDNPPLMTHLFSENGKDLYALTRTGMAAAVDYIELKEARQSSVIATYIAIIAMLISIAVGVWQIISIQDVRIINETIKTEISSFPETKTSQ